jgi:hypothetical protein
MNIAVLVCHATYLFCCAANVRYSLLSQRGEYCSKGMILHGRLGLVDFGCWDTTFFLKKFSNSWHAGYLDAPRCVAQQILYSSLQWGVRRTLTVWSRTVGL